MEIKPKRHLLPLDLVHGVLANSRRYGKLFYRFSFADDIMARYVDHPILKEAGIYMNPVHQSSSSLDSAIIELLRNRLYTQMIPGGEFVPRDYDRVKDFWENYKKEYLEPEESSKIEDLAKDLDNRPFPDTEKYTPPQNQLSN